MLNFRFKLHGFIVTDKTALTPKIEYGTTTSYGSTSAFQTTVPRVTSMEFISHMTNTFSPGTTYHYRFIGASGSQTLYGSDLTFRTYNSETLSDINGNVCNTVDNGAIYDWYTINTGKLCPTGWHVPSDQEWTTLEEFLGENYCDKMFEGWSNESGFSATGTSYRTEDGTG